MCIICFFVSTNPFILPLIPTQNQGRYTPLKEPLTDEFPDSGFVDAQFERPPPKVPWKAIVLAMLLLVMGTVLTTVGGLILTGYIVDPRYADKYIPMLVIGILTFIPGSYHVYLAYYAWMEAPGYSFEHIPDVEL